MNLRSVLDSAFAVASSLGYHPALPENLHATLHKEGFPIALIAPPKVAASNGSAGAPTTCYLSVKFLSKNALTDTERAAAISTLATHAEKYCSLLSSEPHIFSVAIQEIAPTCEVLTIAGEVAVELSANVESVECC